MRFSQIKLLQVPRRAPVDAPSVETLVRLIETDPFSLPADKQVELVSAWEQHSAWLESLKADALTALAGPDPEFAVGSHDDPASPNGEDPHELYRVDDAICDEVATALRVTTWTARRRVAVARDLSYKLPETRQLLKDGQCSYAQAVVVSEECAFLSVAEAREVESSALNRVDRQTAAQTRRSVRRAVANICPIDPAAKLDAEFARRDVQLVSDGGVMATITATLPAPDAIAVWNALTGCAARDGRPDDSRTMAHKRADTLTGWAQRVMDDPAFPQMQGKKRLETQVVITLETLMGLNDDAADINGYGPIPAHLARRLAVESQSWRRLVTDPVTGHLLDFATKTYAPPETLREYVIARDRTCQFPGCGTTGWRCDIDHVEPWTGTADGGQTSAANLITLCRRHHRLKTHNRWRVKIVNPPDDEPNASPETVIRWISPRGMKHDRVRTQAHPPAIPATGLESDLATLLAA